MSDISLAEARAEDFEGKDTIIVVSAVAGRRVPKTAAEKARDARDPNAFDEDFKTIPMGAELYYAVDRATADRMVATDLFYSSVRPESEQLFFALKGLEPVVVHTTGKRGGRSTNFGYRTSNNFEDNCWKIRQTLEAVFGAEDVKVYNFRTAHNSVPRQRFYAERDGGTAVEAWGDWWEVELPAPGSSRPASEKLVRAVAPSWKEVEPRLKKDRLTRPLGELREFFDGLKPKAFSLGESGPEEMMRDFLGEGAVQAEFDFGPAVDWEPMRAAVSGAMEGIPFVEGGFDALVRYAGPLPAWTVGEDGGRMLVSVRQAMHDPLDSEFYDGHFDAVGRALASVPKGFRAEAGARPGDARRYIGGKYVVAKETTRDSDRLGTESWTDYDAVETLWAEPAGRVDESASADDELRERFEAEFRKAFPDVADGDFEVLAYEEDGRQTLNLRVYDEALAADPEFGKMVEALMAGFGCSGVERVEPLPDEQGWATWFSFFGGGGALEESSDGSVEVDFPAWALDYAVNGEPGSVSRQEKAMVDGWFESMRADGWDVGLISYGDEEYFSSSPEFGLPCDCVRAAVPKAKPAAVSETEEPFDPVTRYLTV